MEIDERQDQGAEERPTKRQAKMPSTFEQPWIEKYRPQSLQDVVGNEEAVSRLNAIAEMGNLPNIILSGPPGTGKTTSVLCLARQMLGDAVSEAVLELNASDARGIEVVRSKIKMFAQKKVTLPPGRHKLIILDEADAMTSSAQQALRRTMEIYSNTTRFALACNISSKIIEPIQSRCAILRYSRLSDAQILLRLQQIAEAEGAPVSEDGYEAIIFTAEGDMRNALNNLQATFSGFNHVTRENVFKVCDQPHPQMLAEVISKCTVGDLKGAHQIVRKLWDEGYSAMDIIGTLFKMCKASKMDETLQLEYIKEIGFTHMRISDGMNTYLQLAGLLGRLTKTNAKVAQ
uniref:AAA+ ATPase domain-containing protein n=1 Tax=Rhizochromulina marina TaxID=1034831 RepID=A0A7S2RAW0_9STRA|mmetsp:Transcript_13133/g.38117  ORF Transcript_13133/g.38117 Transcript_13133/m.38117 type:complete len:346 (+) Transcript_13133:103-1140(+)